MSTVYGGYNPKAPKSTSSQEPATNATGRRFAVMPKMGLGLGGLGYSKPPPKPAPASQVPTVPAAASPAASSSAEAPPTTVAAGPATTTTTVIKRESPTPSAAQTEPTTAAPMTHAPRQTHAAAAPQHSQYPPQRSQYVPQQRQQPHQQPRQQQQQQPRQQPHQQPRQQPLRPVMPGMRSQLGYGAQPRPNMVQQQPKREYVDHSYGEAQSSYNRQGSHLFLNVPLREPTPEPEPVVVPEPVVKQEVKVEDDYYYGDVGDIEVQIRNVVCNYTLPLHIDLRRVAQRSNNVTFDRGRGVLLKQKRNPMCYVKIYSSGKVYIVGCRSEAECMTAARRIARNVQRAMNKLHESVRIRNYRVCNVLATCKMPFGVKIEDVAVAHPAESQYEPELSVGLVWRNKEPKATLRIHTTGSVTVTGAQSEADVMTVINMIYPILCKFRCPPRMKGEAEAAVKRKRLAAQALARSRSMDVYRGPRAKMSRVESGVVGGRVVFSDEEDEDDIYGADMYDDE